MTPTIVAVVEGRGDQAAIEVLLRRWFHHHQVFAFQIKVLITNGVIKLLAPHNGQTQHGVEYWIDLAQRHQPCAILVLLDADDECEQPTYRPHGEKLGPWLLSRATAIVGHIPVSVVVADRCFESWFFSPPCQRALQEARLFQGTDLAAADQARGRWEGRLRSLMGRSYSKATDQVKLAMHLPLEKDLAGASRSFLKLQQELARLCHVVSRLGEVPTAGDRELDGS
jgi:Domain of unknown function (DUF4276)